MLRPIRLQYIVDGVQLDSLVVDYTYACAYVPMYECVCIYINDHIYYYNFQLRLHIDL